MTLGLARSTIASHLSAAMTKLGISSRNELVRYLAWEAAVVVERKPADGQLRTLEVHERKAVDLAALTIAELDVARQVAAGASNTEVASERGSRARTVANQLASVYSKLGINSRFELAAMLGSRRLN